MNAHPALTLVILAGGESRRMGQDKALKPFQGEPLVERMVKRLQPIGRKIILIARNPAAYAFLKLPTYTDVRPGVGALGGLLTALSVAKTPFVAVLACDMPFVNPGLLLHQWELIRQNGCDVVIPVENGQPQPFHALYRVATCLPAVRDTIAAGEQRVLSWLGRVSTQRLPTAEIERFDRSHTAFLNLNTPGEFKLAEQIAG